MRRIFLDRSDIGPRHHQVFDAQLREAEQVAQHRLRIVRHGGLTAFLRVAFNDAFEAFSQVFVAREPASQFLQDAGF
jgi:hypothetical protein